LISRGTASGEEGQGREGKGGKLLPTWAVQEDVVDEEASFESGQLESIEPKAGS
jgi:hypothetical protein